MYLTFLLNNTQLVKFSYLISLKLSRLILTPSVRKVLSLLDLPESLSWYQRPFYLKITDFYNLSVGIFRRKTQSVQIEINWLLTGFFLIFSKTIKAIENFVNVTARNFTISPLSSFLWPIIIPSMHWRESYNFLVSCR